MAPGEFRLRIRYRKGGRLRFLSHLEVMRALERSSRRADIPYAVTRGFNPRLKAAFGPALPVGTAGDMEYLDVWLTRYVPAEELLEQLRGAAPADLEPMDARYVSDALPSLAAHCTRAIYEVVVDGGDVTAEAVQRALDVVIEGGEIEVARKRKTKVFDLRRSLPNEPRVRSQGHEIVIDMTTRMSPEGSLRPEQLVTEAFRRSGLNGVVRRITRTDILIEDEGDVRRPL